MLVKRLVYVSLELTGTPFKLEMHNKKNLIIMGYVMRILHYQLLFFFINIIIKKLASVKKNSGNKISINRQFPCLHPS